MNSLLYTYRNTEEILGIIPHLSDFSNYQSITLMFLLGVILFFIYYILPLLSLSVEFIKKDTIKNKRKQFIDSIAMQKELEDEITTQMAIENE